MQSYDVSLKKRNRREKKQSISGERQNTSRERQNTARERQSGDFNTAPYSIASIAAMNLCHKQSKLRRMRP